MQGRIWGLLLVLALAVPAGAQEASFTVSQQDVPVGEELEAGESISIAFDVGLQGDGFSCAAEVEAPVNATLEAQLPSDAPPNASVEPGEDSAAFPIPAGNYHTEPYNQSTAFEVPVETGSGVSENYTATLTLESTFPGGTYDDCLPSEFPEASSEPAEIRLDVVADEPEPEEPVDEEPEEPVNDTNETETPANGTDDGAEENGLPLPATAVPPALIAAALLAGARQRREG